MFSHKLQLVCALLTLTYVHSVQCQALSTATENGIISAAGGPQTTQSISYTIEGTLPTSIMTSFPAVATNDESSPMDNSETSIATNDQERFSLPAIVGTTLAIILAVVGIILFSVYIYKKRREVIARQTRKTILDAEFAAPKEMVQHVKSDTHMHKESNSAGQIGYFDVAKPLPVVTRVSMEEDRLSRSSTIIADAAEIARINRKASTNQTKARKQRSTTRERNHALQSLVGIPDCSDSKLHVPPHKLSSAAINKQQSNRGHENECTDGNGDMFARRPDKI